MMHDRIFGLWQRIVAVSSNMRWVPYRLVHRRHTAVQLGMPWITFLAFEQIESRLRSNHTVLEYGAGGSTIFFASRCDRVVTVEHDAAWASSIRSALADRASRVDIRVVPPRIVAMVPEVRSARFGDSRADFGPYVATCREFPDRSFDLILVDGRARVACIEACHSKLKPGGLLVLDNSERPDYAAASAMLSDWRRQDYFGLGLVCSRPWCTTIWEAPREPGRAGD